MSATLAIDTAGPRLALALLFADGRLETSIADMPSGQAEALFPALAALLERCGITYNDLSRIAATTGPGSFTGLRIGLSAARGLGLALRVPVLGIPTLLAVSLVASGPVAVLLDARRGEAYLQLFSGPGVTATEAALLPLDEAQRRLPPGVATLSDAAVDVALLARFAAAADPAAYPPEATYIRDADAKPQTKFRVARVSP